MNRFFFTLALLSATIAPQAFALDNGLARTPPMGWNSWNKFGCKVSEEPGPRSRRRHRPHRHERRRLSNMW